MYVITSIPFEINREKILEKLHISSTTIEQEFNSFADNVMEIARPKAVYLNAFIQEKKTDSVVIADKEFNSIVLRKNLDDIERVFPFIATCGREMDNKINTGSDVLKQYWLDTLKEEALRCARKKLKQELTAKHGISGLSSMSPGAGDASVWPIEEQKPLFELFGDTEEIIGVTLTESYLMTPNKTVSGILYQSERTFISCRLCHRKVCSGRKAEFDPELAKEYDNN